MFTNNQDENQQKYYVKMLNIIGSLSRLFSANTEPYIDYRITENLFCKSFNAENLSRSDVSADAKKDTLGIGIKTFLDRGGRSFEKIAEFNKHNSLYRDKRNNEKIQIIAELRNRRLNLTKSLHEIDGIIYHCVTRGDNNIYIYEKNAELVNTAEIDITNITDSSIFFNDGINNYKFSNSKSTLYREFIRENTIHEIPVEILEDPFELLEKLLSEDEEQIIEKFVRKDASLFVPEKYLEELPRVYLPLYSEKRGFKYVPKRSGLNQWNADGRWRNSNEIYIRIPSWIHEKFPGFFPPRHNAFNLKLSNGQVISAAVCQQNSKALMSNPNRDLGDWLLRGIMNLEERSLVDYETLDGLGIDSVVIDKINFNTFEIDVAKVGAYEEFKDLNNV